LTQPILTVALAQKGGCEPLTRRCTLRTNATTDGPRQSMTKYSLLTSVNLTVCVCITGQSPFTQR